MVFERRKWGFESTCTVTDADRELEAAANSKLEERGIRVSAYTTPTGFGLVLSWKGQNNVVIRENPFSIDDVLAIAAEWASKLENATLPRGWSYDLW